MFVGDWSGVPPERKREIECRSTDRTDDQSIGLPSVDGIEIVTASSVRFQLIVRSELERLIGG